LVKICKVGMYCNYRNHIWVSFFDGWVATTRI